MKNISLSFAVLLAVALLASCIDDKGNYRYQAPEQPVVVIDEVYPVTVGDRLLVRPQVTFSDKTQLTYHWEISDPVLMDTHHHEGEQLDILFTLRAQLYMARLIVTDHLTGMKYFYPFHISGRTAFSQGVVMLTSGSGGRAGLSFIAAEGTVRQGVYELMNDGEPLPRDPLQLVALYNPNMVGGLYMGYWVICADKDDPGVLVDVNTFVKIRHFKENFFDIPDGQVSAQSFVPLDNGTMAGIVDGKFYVGRFEGYHEWPGFGFFSPPVLGFYTLAPCIAVDQGGTFHWSYDVDKRALVSFIPAAGMMFEAAHMQGPPVNWDPAHVDLDFITLLSGPTGFYLFGRDAGGIMQELSFMSGGQFAMSQYKRPFAHDALVTPGTLWAIYLTDIYFSSGNVVYRYNPSSQVAEPLSAITLPGEVSMLKVGRDANQLLVGTEGHLYWLDIAPGQNGRVIRHVEGFSGKPVDVYDKR
ncbi:MAG: hypothetical protein LBI96_03375 [Odoribacteraceae bacterium]|jgi:hypothetical protein|nr:hypothetical protein [Odoribacteraceae bacterium]